MVELVPLDILSDSLELIRIAGECAKEYRREVDALKKDLKFMVLNYKNQLDFQELRRLTI